MLSIICSPIDFIILSETWLDQQIDYGFEIEGYIKHSLYRHSHGGGLVAYVRVNFESEYIENLSFITDEVEIMTIYVLSPIQFYIVAVYRPPSASTETFNEFLADHFLPIFSSDKCIIIIGDFNINLLNHHQCRDIGVFINNLADHNFFPIVDKPTRLPAGNTTTTAGTLLDHIWLNFTPDSTISSAVVEYEVSDHLPVMFKFQGNRISPDNFVEFRNFKSRSAIDRFKLKLNDVGFSLNNYEDLNTRVNKFSNELYGVFNNCFPVKRKKINNGKRDCGWITRDIKGLFVVKKHVLLKLANKGVIFRRSYIYFRNSLTSILKRAKGIYFKTKLMKCESSGDVWKIVNKTLGRKCINKCTQLKINQIKLTGAPLANHL